MSTYFVRLEGPADIEGFKRGARALLMRGVTPAAVEWRCGDDPRAPLPLLSGEAFDAGAAHVAPADALLVPPWFARLAEFALLHRDAGRFDLLYRLLWRLVREHDEFLRHDELDADRRAAAQLVREVERDIHKMRAFVRFHPHGEGASLRHIAWFEPVHHVVDANAPFFTRRFAQMRWAIFTPERSIEWDGRRLRGGPGVDRSTVPRGDPGAALWLTYYENIFNPARLKLATMAREMPRRYWKNLPEAALIEPLAQAAAARGAAMLTAEPTPARRIKALAPPNRA